MKLEDIKIGSFIQGIIQNDIVKIVNVETLGDALTVYYKDNRGKLAEQMLFRTDEARLSFAQVGRHWAFDAPGAEFKLGLEAYRINMAHLFDPMMAVHSSNVEPYPHQISAVYESMLPRQPLRYVLADDPGAGKTIMAGLLICELLLRADTKRILIITPGSLSEQWQDEMNEKFNVQFDIFSKEKQEQCVSGNYFEEQNLLIARLDQLSRNEDFQEKLKNTDWDLIVVDEAHKLSASWYGNKINKTKRFLLGEILGRITRHFLLMTATPHNGKEQDYQIWLSLLDSDRFYGKFREGVHKVDVTDIMRRMVKEELLKFDGTPLFPERLAYTVNYELSDLETALYSKVTDYVRNEMNRAEKLDGKKKNTIGFALTLLQRRLASSPQAIYQSLKRRRTKLESRLAEMRLFAQGGKISGITFEDQISSRININPELIDDLADELTGEEYEEWMDEVVDQSTAAATIPELESEILILKDLELKAREVVRSGTDKKWEELSNLLQDNSEMYNNAGGRRKLIIFTEHKDTLHYLLDKICSLFGSDSAVDVIHGGIKREDRRKVQEEFKNNKDMIILIGTDAAGEGVNLQNANLMVNYDLPWNPNRLEQRFGRIHRIGQEEVCHLWNIVATGTREGDVFNKLFDKLEVQKKALGGRVFDVLGEAFEGISLKDLLIEAIRYGERQDVKNKLKVKIDNVLETEHLKKIMKRNALVNKHMGIDDLYSIKDEMEKAEARKLQPYFIRSFFAESFTKLGGELKKRESNRFEIKHVPPVIIERDKVIGVSRSPVLRKYERVCFEKSFIKLYGKPMAEMMHPSHPLMQSMTNLILEAHRPKLKQGAVLVNPNDESDEPTILFMLEHALRQSILNQEDDKSTVVSRRLQFISINRNGEAVNAGWAPHLDMEPISSENLNLIGGVLNEQWVIDNPENLALQHATQKLVPEHYQEVKTLKEEQVDKIHAAVQERLTKEINYWSGIYIKLTDEAKAGKKSRLSPEIAKRRYDELTARLEQRNSELTTMRSVVSGVPIVVGGALIIPQGLLAKLKGDKQNVVDATSRAHVEFIAMKAVLRREEQLGNKAWDVSAEKCGWDITSRPPSKKDGALPEDRHIEVKGRSKGQTTITVSRNEIISGLNQKNKFILAIVIVEDDNYEGPYYVYDPFTQEPEVGVASINYNLKNLLKKSQQSE